MGNDDVRRVGWLFHGFLQALAGRGHRWNPTTIGAHHEEGARALAATAWKE
jgi:hypothetical protein